MFSSGNGAAACPVLVLRLLRWLVISAFSMQHDCTDGAHVQTAPESQVYTHLTDMHGSFNILKRFADNFVENF